MILQSVKVPKSDLLVGYEYTDNICCMKVNGKDTLFLFETYIEDGGQTFKSKLHSYDVNEGAKVGTS